LRETNARIVSQLSDRTNLSDADKEWLQLFIFIQQRRTELAVQRMRDFTNSMADAVFARAPEQRPVDDESDTRLMHLSLEMALSQMKYVTDLKVVIFANKSGVELITCDHPAALTNRFHLQKLQKNSFGISNSGAILSMPLTPKLSAMFYDTGVYTIPNATGTSFVDLKHDSDVHALNQIQYLSAGKNLYFKRWEDAERIAAEIIGISEQRAAAGAISKTLIRDDDGVGPSETYRIGTVEEEIAAKETIVVTSFRQPSPKNWPSILKFRDKPKTFYNGTGVGHVRRPEWLSTRP
jgi:hypothetical protein